MVNFCVSCLCCFVFTWQHHRTGRNRICALTAILTVSDGDIRLFYEQVALSGRQQVPVPIADRIVQMVFYILDDQLAFGRQFLLTLGIINRIVSITVGLHVEELHHAV